MHKLHFHVPHLFQKKKSHKKQTDENLIDDQETNTKEVAVVPWYFTNIPYSFKEWVKSNMKQRCNKQLDISDEITLECLYENVEFLLTNQTMTKVDKKEKLIRLLTGVGIKGALEFAEEIMIQIEIFTEEKPQSQQKTLSKQNSSPYISRKRSNTLY